jgi:hypothetical protein
MIHPVESASPSRAARIQQGEDEVQSRASRDRWTFYEAVKLIFHYATGRSERKIRLVQQGRARYSQKKGIVRGW